MYITLEFQQILLKQQPECANVQEAVNRIEKQQKEQTRAFLWACWMRMNSNA